MILGDIDIFTYGSNNKPDGEGITRRWEIGILIKNNKNQAEFTLFKVVVVMTIIAIMRTIALLSPHRFDRGRQVILFANQLTRALKLAQKEALFKTY